MAKTFSGRFVRFRRRFEVKLDDLLKILGEKHRLYDFLSNLSLKCSYLLFNKEHVKEILLEAAMHKTTGHTQEAQSCMDLLVILAHFSPLLLSVVEEHLVTFLKDDNEITKEGVLHVLARAGGTIREQLAASSRQLCLILSMMLQKDDDIMSEAITNKEKERICAVISTLQSIKCSEDIVDVAISKNSHAICGLGLSITKRFVQKDDDLKKLTASVSLPAMLYKSVEKTEVDDSLASGGQTWLVDENVLTHFESLKLEMEIKTEAAQDEILKDSETEGSEVPLGKIVKRLKSQGAKAGKAKMNKSLPAEENNDDVDILKMVREINFHNLDSSSKFESSNGHKHSKAEDQIRSGP